MTTETSWIALLMYEMDEHDDKLANLEYCTLTPEELAVGFDCGYGGPKGKPFTAWTTTRVYFPVCYDGAEWVGSVPRNPVDEPTDHVGGY